MKIILLLFVTYFTLFAQGSQESEKVSSEDTKELAFIALRDIPEQSANAFVAIRKASQELAPKEELSEIDSALKAYSKSINILLNDSRNNYLEYVGIKELDKYENELSVNITQFQSWKRLLEERISTFENYKKELISYDELWRATYENAKNQKAPSAILQQIRSVLDALDTLEKNAKLRYDLLLTNSSTIHSKIIELEEMRERVKEAINIVSSKLFVQNSLSFMDLYRENKLQPKALFLSAYNSLYEKFEETVAYYTIQERELFGFTIIVAIITLFVFLFAYFYKKNRLFVKSESYFKKEYFYIKFPFSTTAILIILANTFMFDLSESVKEIQLLLLLIPVFRILQTQVPKEGMQHFYAYFFLYSIYLVLENSSGAELDSRLFSIVLNVLLALFIYRLKRDKILHFLSKKEFEAIVDKLLLFSIGLLFITIAADIYGATLLADKIGNGVMILLYASMIFYVLTLILTGYIVILLRRRIASASFPMVEKFTQNIEKMTILFIKLFMFAWWFLIVSKTVGVYDSIVEIKNYIMTLSWSLGKTTISVESICDFFMIIFGTWFVVKLVNIILQVEIFSRFKFPRGFPTAITTILNYAIVLSGTIIALLSLGVTTEQFALVFGALGVGIGFGLRNIIANFISGIIMVFERPIQIGDTIEINSILGKVQTIGTRSSTIKTFDGSEVIIPNADFIAKDITNWTLSDEHRRKTLTFRVALESEIEEVLEIMKSVATAHQDVLKSPEPLATFVSFGEYYLEFKLYFWLSDNLIVAPSDIAVGVYKLLQEHNISMPTPKQQLINEEKMI